MQFVPICLIASVKDAEQKCASSLRVPSSCFRNLSKNKCYFFGNLAKYTEMNTPPITLWCDLNEALNIIKMWELYMFGSGPSFLTKSYFLFIDGFPYYSLLAVFGEIAAVWKTETQTVRDY